MKWYEKEISEIGTLRIRSGFLTIPLEIDGETRWMEYAEWEEERILKYDQAGCSAWKPTKWLN